MCAYLFPQIYFPLFIYSSNMYIFSPLFLDSIYQYFMYYICLLLILLLILLMYILMYIYIYISFIAVFLALSTMSGTEGMHLSD